MRPENIRNFSIVAHIDHGKSTLADRILLQTGAISEREFRDQVLDDMDLERERGITIKARAVAIRYQRDNEEYELNLIDTPGHVDFHYEVSRSLAACEGALLLVDATQGVQAQTVANAYLALDGDLAIIPVVNKIDMAAARPEEVAEEMDSTFGFTPEECLPCSAKTGMGVDRIIDAIIEQVPPPPGNPDDKLRALIFDSHFDEFRGVIIYVRLIDGELRKGQRVKMLSTNATYDVTELGQFRPQRRAVDSLSAGQVGYVIASIKDLRDIHIGDTVTDAANPSADRLPGYEEPKPMVYCGIFPTDNDDYDDLRQALLKLSLNDSSFSFEPESNEGLGFGFRCGFLGMLHMEIIAQRLEREEDIDLVQTAPSVTYELGLRDETTISINSPDKVPDPSTIESWSEPIAKVSFITPSDSIGPIMQLCQDRRGKYLRTEYLSQSRTILVYELPLAELIVDVYDRLKSITRGYGTLDYEIIGFQKADLVKMDVMVASEKVDALSTIVHREFAMKRGRRLVQKLKQEIERHMFPIAVQAAIGGKIIARETISALRKNVTAKCYGGDISRKRKLLEKQKEGKKRMKQFGRVEIPQKAFLAVLQMESE
ncbi:Elongation factor 4 [Planctomycetes bacterium Pan216]|uniref:Elongation factor 4 n=1 Tax=Kolteria novifilia TaxID=2527975 RepID=A0A518B277_9BACT|nr:Elongation factor 4 [Planctomycetes bacterium Pan216]